MNKTIRIGKQEVGGLRTFVVAEIGSNHMQDLQRAKAHIDAARAAGADAVKFQSIQLDALYFDPDPDTRLFIRKLEMDERWHQILKDYCDEREMVFFSSPTYLRAVDVMEAVDVALYKLASAQVGTFPQLVKKVACTGKPVLCSTGLVTLRGVEQLVQVFRECGNDQFIVLHCNSLYPTPPARVHLPLMLAYAQWFGNPVGFSDHTLDIHIPIAAAALGAKVIEKHFTLDSTLPSPDAAFALEPDRFAEMVRGIRAVEEAVQGSARVDIDPEARRFKDSIRTRLVLKHEKKAGARFSAADFVFLRHHEGIDCRDLDFILERQAKARGDLPARTLLAWGQVCF